MNSITNNFSGPPILSVTSVVSTASSSDPVTDVACSAMQKLSLEKKQSNDEGKMDVESFPSQLPSKPPQEIFDAWVKQRLEREAARFSDNEKRCLSDLNRASQQGRTEEVSQLIFTIRMMRQIVKNFPSPKEVWQNLYKDNDPHFIQMLNEFSKKLSKS